MEHDNPKTLGPLGVADQWLAALFTSVAARTAGFNAVDIGALELESLVLHCVWMFIGGGSAGTAGGVKVTTVFLLLLIVWSEIRGRADVELRGRRIGTQVQRQALSILVLSGAAVSLGLLLIIPMADHLPLEKLLFEVVSAFATVGLSTGITAELPPGAQVVIIALMYAGRVGAVFTLARFREAFLVLRAEQSGVPLALVPLVMVAMNGVYAASAYPFGRLADRMDHRTLLALGLAVLIAADLVLASGTHWATLLAGVALWGVHMGLTQGLLATMVADTAPADLRGTAFGFFNLVSGVALLLASVVAGLLWDRLGAAFTFYAGAGFSALGLLGLWMRRGA